MYSLAILYGHLPSYLQYLETNVVTICHLCSCLMNVNIKRQETKPNMSQPY